MVFCIAFVNEKTQNDSLIKYRNQEDFKFEIESIILYVNRYEYIGTIRSKVEAYIGKIKTPTSEYTVGDNLTKDNSNTKFCYTKDSALNLCLEEFEFWLKINK